MIDVDELERLCKATPPGQWEASGTAVYRLGGEHGGLRDVATVAARSFVGGAHPIARFIAEAHNAVPELCDAVRTHAELAAHAQADLARERRLGQSRRDAFDALSAAQGALQDQCEMMRRGLAVMAGLLEMEPEEAMDVLRQEWEEHKAKLERGEI